MDTTTQPRRFAGLAACLAAVVAAGCGGAEEGARTSARASDGVRPLGGQAMIDAQTRMARCMRRQGIDFPDPTPGRGFEFEADVNEPRLRAAERKCARFARAVAEAAPRQSEHERQRARDATLRYARCMRSHGARVPDPRASGEGGGTAVEVPADAKRDPRFQRAAARCEDVLRGR